jgi:thiamine kinase-like enzyme
MEDYVKSAIKRIPQLRGKNNLEISRLGGLTNLVFHVKDGSNDYLLRIPGDGTEEYIDRAVEIHNARIAAEAGVSAQILFADESDGLMLAEYLGGSITMSPEHFTSIEGSPARAAIALKKLHTCGKQFQFRFELFAMIDEYLAMLKKLGAQLPDGYHDIVQAAKPVRDALDASPTDLAPCHCDPLCENFLDTGTHMWIVDWEYSGMNDPLWDLGDLSVEAGFDEAQDREMMEAYCDKNVPDAMFGRMVIYKAMCDLLWTLWWLIQHANNNPAEDFWAYSTGRFERCKSLMASDNFAKHLASISK